MKYVFEFEFDSHEVFKVTGLTPDEYEKELLNSINKLNKKLKNKNDNGKKNQSYKRIN